MQWRDQDGVRWLEADLPAARAAFSTRLGGASKGAFESLNLGLYTDDDETAVRTNRARLAAALRRDPEGVLFGFQVHGAEIERRERPPVPNPYASAAADRPSDGDGQVTSNPELTPLVQVADCLPVALVGERGVGMLHCGWRGLASGIVARGAQEVGATAAAVGPGIGPCCYEVGEEVLDAFGDLGSGIAAGRMLDLPEVARRLLARAGIEAIDSTDLCTSCEPELFFSHRRDAGRTGRQAGLAWIDADA
jgi:polyphenol oxidase